MSEPIVGKLPKYSSDWYRKPGVVYFIGADQPVVAIKIGVTRRNKVKQRLRAIQCDNHEPVELLGVILFDQLLDAEKREQSLHIQFKGYQRIVDGHVGHEWFTVGADLLAFIRDNAKPPEEVGSPKSVAKLPARS